MFSSLFQQRTCEIASHVLYAVTTHQQSHNDVFKSTYKQYVSFDLKNVPITKSQPFAQ